MIHIPQFNIDKNLWIEGNLLWGKKLALEIRKQLAQNVKEKNIEPGLAVILVGEDEASKIYVGSKEKVSREIGYKSIVQRMRSDVREEEILEVVNDWNRDSSIHGILVQLPLPGAINERNILQAISPRKDVDGFHFENIGRLHAKSEGIIPCTPLGIMVMLKEIDEKLTGLNTVVLGRSNIVGKPMAQMLMDHSQATVTICHSKTQNLDYYIQNADIIVSAMGVRNIIKNEWVKNGAIIIDVGMHRAENGVCGDLDYKELKEKARYITPVPGGVGPMTIAMLMYNTYNNALKARQG
ncbi:MAG: bifunctional 5,10-methylene-tetrahydrofolate dehydrogenase/5,10-methylene-tetrahydrofolate cyclohydrolase [Spirochaetia bacterium]|nr:bifunctional 5,10-methylene-tetrahydrofolate dehydrogenase/5,10-methylene-tetrahydrofolate cyclohydrolase [Spirochaetia bacterium]